MALNGYPNLSSDGLTAAERMRKNVRDILREQITDRTDDEIWALTIAVTDQSTFMPPGPVSLTYAWSDGQAFSIVDRPGGCPNDSRERSILRALLVHALKLLDEVEDHPLVAVGCGPVSA